VLTFFNIEEIKTRDQIARPGPIRSRIGVKVGVFEIITK
jgi:hypothetical protein